MAKTALQRLKHNAEGKKLAQKLFDSKDRERINFILIAYMTDRETIAQLTKISNRNTEARKLF